MRKQTWLRWVVGIAAICGAAALAVTLAFQPIARYGADAAARMAGYRLDYETLVIRPDSAYARGLRIRNAAGEPIADVGSLSLRYSVGDALRGTRQFGIRSFDAERPHIVLIRHKDGTWNVPSGSGQNQRPSSAPFAFDGVIRDGSIDVYDRAQGVVAARHLTIRAMNATMAIATAGRSTYTASLAYEEAGVRYPVDGAGTIDAPRGYELQRWTAADLPIAHLVDVGLNSPSMHVAGGSLRNLDARILGLPGADGTSDRHIDAIASLDRARIAIGGLRKPLRDVHGTLRVYGDGLVLQNVHATIANVPVVLGGGVYDLTKPSFQLTVNGTGDLRDLRTIVAQSSALPVSGRTRIGVAVKGPASKPLILIGLRSPLVHYAGAALQRPGGLIAFDGQEADVVDFRTGYAGMQSRLNGKATLHAGPRALELVAGIDAPAASIPYAGAVIGSMPLHATILASSDTLRTIDARGIVRGTTRGSALDARFDIAGNGVGTAGPLRITRSDGASLYATAFFDRSRQRVDAFLDAAHYPLVLPQLAARLDGRVSGSYDRGVIRGAGWTELTGVRSAYTTVARVSARFGDAAGRPLTVAVDASGIGTYGAVANALLEYRNGNIDVREASASARGAFVIGHGNVRGLRTGSIRYDAHARVHAADVSSLVAIVAPQRARLLEGSANANIGITGDARSTDISGTVHSAEGAVNGLPFRALNARIDGTPSSFHVNDGSVDVGSTAVAFDGFYGPGYGGSVRASRADLSDFNDFFDAGDMLAGTGNIAANAAFDGNSIATAGTVALTDAKVRNFDIGFARARWNTYRGLVRTDLAFGGTNGTVSADGSVTTGGSLTNMRVRARNVEVGNWLAMSGFALPVTGRADADATLDGRWPSLRADVTAHAIDAGVGRIPVERVDLTASMRGRRVAIRSLAAAVPYATLRGSGSFGLGERDAVALNFEAHTNDIGKLSKTISGKAVDASGSADTQVKISGNRVDPQIDDRFMARSLRYGDLNVPRIAGGIRADRNSLALARTEVDLQKGMLIADGSIPITLSPFQIDPRNRPVAFDLLADDVDVSNFAAALPPKTHIAGRFDGHVTAAGTVRDPQFGGTLAFADGYYSGPIDTVPVKNIAATVTFVGTSATLARAHANVGAGTVDADGRAAIPNLRDASKVSMQFNARIAHATIDSPAYLKGRLNGDLQVTKAVGARPELGGTIAVDSARIPMTALYNPKPANAPAAAPPDVGLNLHVIAGRDVRVQSPNVDIGAEGSVDAGGTFAAPTLAGAFDSTGGTVSFYRTFRIESGTVTFDPASGIVPDVDALATTHVDDPPTDVALRVTGPATNLNLAFDSNPQYDRAQILGLLVNAQALGAVSGVATTQGSGSPSASGLASSLAQGQINQLFTRNLLEPFSVAAGGALGLSNLQVTGGLGSGLGVSAVKAFGKTVNVVYADTFNLPRRQSISIQVNPGKSTQLQLTAYTTQGQTLFALEQPPASTSSQGFGNITTIPTGSGANGIDFSLKRTFP
ncbi:MAG: translocation/assembly module TamB [Candidatus Eremiobacteraeota bacterium]|nr:translocation/assembly module TamB [Candidatus Eremiobacteraeota bacterium]